MTSVKWLNFWWITYMLGLVDNFSDKWLALLADLFLYSVDNEFSHKLIKECNRKLARKFNLSYRYIDDFISFNNKRFKEFISDIYAKELTIFETAEPTSVASCLDLLFTWDKSNSITTKLYDKLNVFDFHIVNFPLCQAIFYQHQHQVMVTMHLSSFAMPVVAQIMVTFYHATGPLWQDFCHSVTTLIVCPTHLRNSMVDTLI